LTYTPVTDAYVTVEEAVILLSALPPSPGITTWLNLSSEQQGQTLFAAVRVLDCLSWLGHKCSCDQPLEWPRRIAVGCCCTTCEEIPQDIKLANAYLAAYMGEEGGFTGIKQNTGGSSALSDLEPFSEVNVGPIKVKLKEDITYGDEPPTNVGQIPPFVADLLRNYLTAFGAREGVMGRRSIARAYGGYIGSPAYSGTMFLRNGKVYPRWGGWASNMHRREW
jgi:hypothetical protein